MRQPGQEVVGGAEHIRLRSLSRGSTFRKTTFLIFYLYDLTTLRERGFEHLVYLLESDFQNVLLADNTTNSISVPWHGCPRCERYLTYPSAGCSPLVAGHLLVSNDSERPVSSACSPPVDRFELTPIT